MRKYKAVRYISTITRQEVEVMATHAIDAQERLHSGEGTVLQEESDATTTIEHVSCTTVEMDQWINIYPSGNRNAVHNTKEQADASAFSDRLACVRIDYTYTQGEGI